ncbi:spore germination protein GerPC [Bacillus shivajii]|uniref:spore germination protein GerPC n=1 Tax=Bacillus shivajii TaxID=1983719 RepID=UPI001CFC1719|nr:spore germination protein GerPC [Bacillus shivajii]UCZ51454.1 spore germination protein GerPC [Bacillus shivajii]
MYQNWDMYAYYQKLHDHVNKLQHTISQMEMTISQLQKEVSELKENQQPANIEYKFDQLKVEKLEGTLNIGLSPQNGAQSIEDFTVNQNDLHVRSDENYSNIYENIKRTIYHYLENDCYQILNEFEIKHKYELDQMYRDFIINDVKKQIDRRIEYYLNKVNLNTETNEEQTEIVKEITIKVKEDINNTLDSFIRSLPKGQGG